MQTIADLIDRNAAWFPSNEAFVLDDRRPTYRQFAERARRLGASLYGLGLRSQDRLAVLSTNNLEYFEIYGACELAGFVAALFNFRCAAPEVAYLLKDAAPKAVFFEHQFAGLIDGLRAQFQHIEHWVCIGARAADVVPEWAHAYESLVERGDPAGAPIRPEPHHAVYLFYTSGTTGVPKGVPWHHADVLQVARNEGRFMGAHARVLQLSPAYHVGGKGMPTGALWLAGTVVLDRAGFDATRFLRTVERERITHTFMVPATMQAALEVLERETFDLGSLRAVMAASTAIPAPLLRRAIAKFGQVFYVAYGSTEGAGIAATSTQELRPDGTPDDIRRLSSVGHFQPETEAVILDDDCRPCAPNQRGEVCVKSGVFRGYWNNSVATAEALRGGWFHTGDVGYLDEEGYLFLVDRKKDMIISGGENIYSREVEDALYRHTAVREAAVIGVPDEKWGEVVKAIVSLREDETATEAELIAFCQSQIARFKCPKSIVFLDALPLLGPGKIDKVILRKQYRTG